METIRVLESSVKIEHKSIYNVSTEPSSEEEEEWEDVNSSDEDENEILTQAFAPDPNDILNYDSSAPPQNGSQYLLSVQSERVKLPKVFSASKDIVTQFDAINAQNQQDGSNIDEIASIADGAEALNEEVGGIENEAEFMPTESWNAIVLHQFSNISQKMTWRRERVRDGNLENLTEVLRLPHDFSFPGPKEKLKWLVFFFGSKIGHQLISHKRNSVTSVNSLSTFFNVDILPSVVEPIVKIETECENIGENLVVDEEEEEEEEEEEKLPTFPLIRIMLNLTNPTIETLIKRHVKWIKHYGWFHQHQGTWLYALLSNLEKPLGSDTTSDLRDLAKSAKRTRKLVLDSFRKVVEIGEEINKNELKEFTNTLNLFIVIVSYYFSQFDLCDKRS